MLAYILAIAVAIGSFSFYMAAFFVPEMHRRQDFFWSGLGMFYAVVLWFCAGRLTGAVLLGQLVSVILLGGLGWHTLELRRSLTPELVQTPVSWEDLQSLVQGLQQQLHKYLRFNEVTRRLQAAGQQISLAVANWRDRTATSSDAEAPAEVPPLKRSPAYEFETATGNGQAVPSEFATVASRQLPDLESTETAPTETMADTVSAEAAPLTTDDTKVDEAQPAEAEIFDVPERLTNLTSKEATPSPAQSLRPPTSQPQETEPASPQPSVTAPSPAQTQPVSSQSQQPPPKTNPITGAFGKLAAAISGRSQSKPQRSVIEIPPRPPSISRDSAAPSSASSPAEKRPSKSQRAVIDIPPRPPSIPRSPATSTTTKVTSSSDRRQSVTNDDVNWVDGGEVSPAQKDEQMESAASSGNTAQPEPSASSIADVNWPDTETNWPQQDNDMSISDIPQEQPDKSLPSPDDTNWPDDEDTNWPD
ncbi:MAG: hypothetical protein F6K00_21985 [Leptolyngbya sp. SIOISBB]|nr:hypothetical protein [Leptolyngbya sp. SIOISBB]